MKKELNHADLLAALHYDPETGVWTYLRVARAQPYKIGDRADREAKSTPRQGYVGPPYIYRKVAIGKNKHLAHRLAYFYMLGSWPLPGIDHKDRNPSNNKWENLRIATQTQNNANAKLRIDNNSGHKGICWSEERKKWCAYIGFKGRVYPLGRFNSLEEAVAARQNQAEKLFGEYARHA